MIWRSVGLLFLISLSAIAPARAVETAAVDVRAWPRMSADKFGCYLERTFGVRDPRFNCALTNYENKGDPCTDAPANTEGPAFPDAVASRVHPALKAIHLTWEGGRLQAVTLETQAKMPEGELRRAFGLPDGEPFPDNIMIVDVQDCSEAGTCLVLIGFEHMGAADLDCGDAPAGSFEE